MTQQSEHNVAEIQALFNAVMHQTVPEAQALMWQTLREDPVTIKRLVFARRLREQLIAEEWKNAA